MGDLFQVSTSLVSSVDVKFKRYSRGAINWQNRLIIIVGARGVGKTTLILQYIKENLMAKPDEFLYVSLDDLYFSKNNLVDFAGDFVKRGGRYLFLDEVHKYKNWSQEIKSSYDYYPELKMVVTGSSALDIYKGKADLSRRAILYKMNGLSFREFIELKYNKVFPVLTLEELLENPSDPAQGILQEIKPVKLFEEYIQWGYYPFFSEGIQDYSSRIKQIVNQVLESDLPSVANIDFLAVHHLKKLLSIISEMVPFKPNILKLSKQIGISRETLVRYLYLLERADMVLLLESGIKGSSRLNKPEKIFLNNTNLSTTFSKENANTGTMRETFFFNQLHVKHNVQYTSPGDFIVDGEYIFEIGGKNKNQKQIAGIHKAYIAADNIEYPHGNIIPLWLFGFLY